MTPEDVEYLVHKWARRAALWIAIAIFVGALYLVWSPN